jgi:hypothetical protein
MPNFGRHVQLELGLERFFGVKTHPQLLLRKSIWLLSTPFYYMAARRGLSLHRPWPVWRGFTLGLHGAWHRRINRGKALKRSRSTQGQRTY